MNNIQVSPGAGADPAVATEEIAGHHFQAVKLVDGSPASTTPIAGTPDGELKTELSDIRAVLELLLQAAVLPMWMDPASGRLRMVLDGSNTLTTLSNITNLGAANAGVYALDCSHAAWAEVVRAQIT